MSAADGRSEWSEPSRVAEYLARTLPFRDVAESLLTEALPGRVGDVLDLGTGDGRLLAVVDRARPGGRLKGLDVSAPMLERAAARFADRRDDPVELEAHDLSEPLQEPPASFDVVISGLAVHHTEHERRRDLFREVHAVLRPGGVYAQLDLVQSPTAGLHAEFRRAIGREQDDPSDRLAALEDELGWLREAGFREVDCRFKWRELVLLVARA